jgi:transcriptional regulator with XRE-family HTH domain
MLHTEFIAYLRRSQLTQSQFARILGVEPLTVWRWSKGGRPIPKYAENMIYLLLSFPDAKVLGIRGRSIELPSLTPHEILGIPTTANRIEAKKAWKNLSLIVHPDRGGCTESMKRVNAAFDSIRKSSSPD